MILKRRLFGNKTERSRTNELQLTLGNLLDREKELQKELEKAAIAAREAAAADEVLSRTLVDVRWRGLDDGHHAARTVARAA